MKYRVLGSTNRRVSELSFGAGPVAALMTDKENAQLQRQTIQRALEAGLNWFDTAPTYGAGESERNLGAALADLGASCDVGVATKVRLLSEQLGNIKETVKSSVAESLRRLRRPRITLIQLHNSVTKQRGDQPTSITPEDVLGRDGVLEAFQELKADGVVEHFGLTGLGDTSALEEVIRSGPWAAIQECDNALHPREPRQLPALATVPTPDNAKKQWPGVIAIRVLAGGALAGQPPSAHTLTTKFFPLAIYRQDQARAARLAQALPASMSLAEFAIRYVLSDSEVATALIGFASPEQIDEAVRFAEARPLDRTFIQSVLDEAQLEPDNGC